MPAADWHSSGPSLTPLLYLKPKILSTITTENWYLDTTKAWV